jgi:uncharacterized membrane protein YwaF
MTEFFAANYTGPAFEFLGTTHLAALGALVFLNLFLILFKNASDGTKAGLRWILALILWGNEIAFHYWNYTVGRWTIQTMRHASVQCARLGWAWMLQKLPITVHVLHGIAGDPALTTRSWRLRLPIFVSLVYLTRTHRPSASTLLWKPPNQIHTGFQSGCSSIYDYLFINSYIAQLLMINMTEIQPARPAPE